jgi:hypothetical protein
MKEPKFPKPVGEMKDAQLIKGINRVLAYLAFTAKQNHCPGDITSGWDWPTANAVYPEMVGSYRAMRTEALRRLEANKGILNKVQYAKNERGNWVAVLVIQSEANSPS